MCVYCNQAFIYPWSNCKLDIKPKIVLFFILNGAYKDQLLVYRSLVVRFLKLGECTEVR